MGSMAASDQIGASIAPFVVLLVRNSYGYDATIRKKKY